MAATDQQALGPDTVPWTRTERFAGLVLAWSGTLLGGFVALTGLLAAVLVPVHGWRPPVVVPVLLVLFVALLPLVRHVPSRPAPAWTAAACVAIATGHGLWAALTHAEHVVLRRDAGSYSLYTEWIATRHGLQIPAHLDAFGGAAALADPAFRLASPAFFEVSTGTGAQIVPQFLLGAPALFSLGWWTTGGWTGVFVVPAILSAGALLAVAGLVTRLCGARWAVPVTATLAVCQPILHAARSTYSEPAALLLVAAAAGLLVDAVRSGNPEPPARLGLSSEEGDGTSSRPGSETSSRLGAKLSSRLGLAAGLGFGLAGLIRVDALREVSLLLPVAAVLALRGHPAARSLVVGALGGTAIAAVPAVLLSRPYLGGIAGSLVPLIGGGVVLGLGSLVAVRWGPAIGRRLPRIRGFPQVAAVLVLLVGVLLATRPLWLTVRQSAADPGSRVVAGLQLRQGLTVDGGRTYAEQSVNWLNWYLGPVVLLAALVLFAGLAAATVRWWRSGSGKVPIWLGPAVLALGSVLLTLYRPGITPDHPWADRRMVPVVLPAMVIAAGALLAWAGRIARRRWSAPVLIGVLVAGAIGMLLPAWLATAPLAGATGRTERGEPAAVATVCAALRPGDAVITIDARGSNEWPQLVRGVCDRPSMSVRATPAGTPEAALRIGARVTAAGRRPVYLAASADGVDVLTAMKLNPEQLVDLRTTEDQHLLERRPDGVDLLDVQVWIATSPS